MIDPTDLRDVFDRAASLPPQDRAAFLARTCGDNAALRQEVERLLSADQRAGSVFDSGSGGGVERDARARDDASALWPGARLGPYVIVGAAGHGGMGEVYRARDTRLDRTVALKVLPAELVRDPAARRRFEREARAAAALSHPHICTLLDIGRQDDTDFLVMEFVEGDTLAHRLVRETPPLRESLHIGIEIAEALVAAHAAHIIHRDIKPGNVMQRPDGVVKVLDFGLAKLASIATDGGDTTQALSTRAGLIVGTVAYMSPEQARGQDVDSRTDVWSFGCVLYELAAGRAPFAGTSTTDVLAAVLQSDPIPLPVIDATIPAELQRIVAKALRKDRNERYQTVRDLLIDLNTLRESLVRSSDAIVAIPPRTSTVRRVAPWIVAAGVVLVAALVVSRLYRNSEPNTGASTKDLPETQITALPGADIAGIQISPDGRYLSYGDSRGVIVRNVATSEEQVLPDTKDMSAGPWSADSTRFRVGGKEDFEMSLLGSRRSVPPGTPSPDESRLARVEEETLIVTDAAGEHEQTCHFPQVTHPPGAHPMALSWSPDGRFVATAWAAVSPRVGATPEGRLEMVEVETCQLQVILSVPGFDYGIESLTMLPDWRILYASCGGPEGCWNLWSVTIDPKTGARASEPKQLSHWPGGPEIGALSATADGKRLVYMKAVTQGDVWIANIDGAGPDLERFQRLTPDDLTEAPTSWSVDSRSVVMQVEGRGIFSQSLDSNVAKPLATGPGEIRGPQTSPDGRWVLFLFRATPKEPMQIRRVPAAGGAAQTVLVSPDFVFYRCQTHSRCILVERHGADDVIFDFDPMQGRGKELFRKPAGTGDPVIIAKDNQFAFQVGQPKSSIRVTTLAGDIVQEIRLPGDEEWHSLDWAPVRNGFIATSRAVVMFVPFNGPPHVMHKDERYVGWAIPSPDGKNVALAIWSQTSNGWMTELP